METIISVVSLIVSGLACLFAYSQTNIARQQLKQSESTKSETEKLLSEIKEKVVKIEDLSNETRKDVKDNVSKMVDKTNEHLAKLIDAPAKNSQNDMIANMLPTLMKNPDTMKMLIQLADKK